MEHRRYYQIAGITIQVESELPITEATFDQKFQSFRVDGPGEDTVVIQHRFQLPDLGSQDLGTKIYHKAPWMIYQKGRSWIYVGYALIDEGLQRPQRIVMFNHDHTHGVIHNRFNQAYLQGGLESLTMFPSDQILIARLLADRFGCYLHSAGAILDTSGLLFVGHSEAGKSTASKLLLSSHERMQGDSHSSGQIEILCDDRNIVRLWDSGWRVHGTWSHGEIPHVSPKSAPLRAILFLTKAEENRLIPLTDRRNVIRRLLSCLIKPFVTSEWWEKTLVLIERLAQEIPCYEMQFDTSGKIVSELYGLKIRIQTATEHYGQELMADHAASTDLKSENGIHPKTETP